MWKKASTKNGLRKWGAKMFYVSYITEYPIYEAAEGGYYYPGTLVQACHEFSSWKKANKCYQEWRKWFLEQHEDEPERINDSIVGGVGRYRHPGVYYNARYIGDDERVELTRKKPIEHGYEPYC